MARDRNPQSGEPESMIRQDSYVEGASGVEGARGGLNARRRIGANKSTDLLGEENAINAGEEGDISSQISDAVTNAINSLRIYGGGDIVVSGKNGSWVVSRRTELEDKDDIPDEPSDVEVSACALGSFVDDEVNAGMKRIATGFISGGGSSIFLSYDNYTPVAGDVFYIEVNWLGVEEDGVLLNGGSMVSATIEKTNVGIPGDIEPIVGSLPGTARIPLGTWIDADTFDGNGCGGRNISFCAEGGFQSWI